MDARPAIVIDLFLVKGDVCLGGHQIADQPPIIPRFIFRAEQVVEVERRQHGVFFNAHQSVIGSEVAALLCLANLKLCLVAGVFVVRCNAVHAAGTGEGNRARLGVAN